MENNKGLDLSLGLLCGGPSDSLKEKSCSSSEDVGRNKNLINDFKTFLEGGTVRHDLDIGTQSNDPVKKEENFFNDLSKTPIDVETSKGLDGDKFIAASYTNFAEVEGEKRLDVGEKRKSLFGEQSQQKKLEREAHHGDLHDNVKTSIYQLPGMLHLMAAKNSEGSGSGPVMPVNMPSMFRYSSVQLPMLDKDNSLSLVSHQQQPIPYDAGKGEVSSDKHGDVLKIAQASPQVISLKSSEAPHFDGRLFEQIKVDGNDRVTLENSSSRIEDDVKQGQTIFRSTPSEQRRVDGAPSDYPSTRPGLAADLKFGGCGSSPNLPWVSTTAPGPNGKTISGVTYRYSPTQLRIVCACHGSHMSPDEFVRHSCEEQTNPDASTSVASSPNANTEASAQS